MGNRVNRPRFIEWDLDHLESITTLSKQQYLNLYDQYHHNQAWGGQNMDDKLFFQKYEEMLPGEQTKEESDRAFHAFDYNNSGKLSFEEFVGVVVLLNTHSNALNGITYLIDQYNPTGSTKQIEQGFGQLIFNRLNQYYGIQNVDSAVAWSELSASSGGNTNQVSREQFLAFIAAHPVYRTHIHP